MHAESILQRSSHDGNDGRKIFRFTTGHDSIDRHLLDAAGDVIWWHAADQLASFQLGSGQHAHDPHRRWRNNRQAISPTAIEAGFHVVFSVGKLNTSRFEFLTVKFGG